MSRSRLLLLVCLLFSLPVAAEAFRQERELMHTRVTVVIVEPSVTPALDAGFEEVFAVFAGIEQNLNEWKPDSALGRINAAAGGPSVQVDQQTCEVVEIALQGAKRTAGLFDPTWAALKNTWRFGDDDEPKIPLAEEIARQCTLVGASRVELKRNANGCTVRLPEAGMKLGLSGLVKGWGVDQAVKKLRARGFKNFFIQAGGDLYMAGKNGPKPWKAGIRDPRGAPDELFARLEVTDRAFSTSGDYEHFFEVDGQRFHHIIDPRTCRPSPASRSVTVLSQSATDAEILSKAAFILGGSAGVKLLEREKAAGVLVDGNNTVHVSKSLAKRLERWPLQN